MFAFKCNEQTWLWRGFSLEIKQIQYQDFYTYVPPASIYQKCDGEQGLYEATVFLQSELAQK